LARELDRRSFLARRLTIAIATPIVMLLVMGVLLARQLLQMAEDAALVEHTGQVISAAQAAVVEIVDQERALRGYLLTDDRTFLEPYERARPLQGFDRLHALSADNPAQQARFAAARRDYESWLSAAEHAVRIDPSEARTLQAMFERRRRMEAIRAAMDAAVRVEEDLRTARMRTSSASTEQSKRVFVGLLLGVAVLMAFLSRRELAAIAGTFGAALDAEKEAREATEREAWIREGQALLSRALLGDKSIRQLASDGLSTLASYAGAPVGAFFVRENGVWQRRAGVALDDSRNGGEVFADGEGLIGRAAAEGKLLDLRDVPADFLKLRSGTGEVMPSQLIVVPAMVDGQPYAVLELGFLRAADARAIELLERVGENVALAVRSAGDRQRLRSLLEQTQRQSEELQSQQEELRVQNEELEEQTRALQDAQSRMENQQAELEQINTQLEEQTQALAAQRDELKRSQVELRRASEYKSEFLANMSHELRTPLNSSLILAKLLADNRHGHLDEEEVAFARTIYSAGNDLLTLISDILDLSKIEAGKLDVRPETVVVERVLSDLSSTFQPIASDKGLALELSVEPGTPARLDTDSIRLQQILKNLLSNALKFTEQGGVTMRVRAAEAGRLAFEVKDTGIGISEGQREAIFEAFRQGDGTTNRKYGGTGLGLSISRDLARLLGGDLSVESEVGRGSTFVLVVPVQFAGPVPLPEPRREPPRPAPRPREEAPAPKRPEPVPVLPDDRDKLEPGGRSILIVEDDLKFARVLLDLARELDFKALVAATAEEGLALAARHRPSGIVLDIGLPDRSGLSVLDVLKHEPATRHIPVHVISASDYAQAALEMGATGYAVKPIEREELVRALKKLETKFTQALRRILIVEDDEQHRDSTSRLLAGDDVETVAVGTAREALEQLQSTTFDCMVLDLSLPDRTGFELLEEMSRQQQYGFPPVIVYTGRSLSRDEEQQLRRFSRSIIIKGARSPERLLDEVTLFLHQVEADLPPDRQRMLREARSRDAVFEGRRILVVEDDIRNIFALKSLLEPKGAKVEVARNGKEALGHLRDKGKVDLVLMDIMMPEMDGLEATREIRKLPELARLPIIALTAKAMADDRESCLAAGANDYIAKPLDVDKLLSLTRVWMPR
jgi:CheY-like chemotaxis protein/CHASE3 domain sensor protein